MRGAAPIVRGGMITMSQDQPARPFQLSEVFTGPRIVCWGIGLIGLILFVETWGQFGA